MQAGRALPSNREPGGRSSTSVRSAEGFEPGELRWTTARRRAPVDVPGRALEKRRLNPPASAAGADVVSPKATIDPLPSACEVAE